MDPLGQLIAWAAEYGLLGVFLVAFSERIVPIFPSYAILVAIGIASQSGAWAAPAGLMAAVAGSYVGGSIYYLMAVSVPVERATRFLIRFALLFGTSSARVESLIVYFRTNQSALSFTSQLIPTIRLVAPAIAGLLKVRPGPFALASGIGVTIWNGLFFIIGYICASYSFSGNITTLALEVMIILMVSEGIAFFVWRRWRRAKLAENR
ncbi:membrane-associated protein [Neorhizobium lilium]|uniref:Membrane-associated protein n=1 Tax=Neorhizobium lilium TaxID=2503024 RepID=A0A444LF72_9HYPH|nr:VTT domain-containing protein [Neorhizobium lilium]RWX76837.1 membrane-associated protein [Neorhizobium lilium]